MSRSRKRPFTKVCGHSDKLAKRFANRAVRRLCREVLENALKKSDPDVVLPHRRECPNNDPWCWPSDGKMYARKSNLGGAQIGILLNDPNARQDGLADSVKYWLDFGNDDEVRRK